MFGEMVMGILEAKSPLYRKVAATASAAVDLSDEVFCYNNNLPSNRFLSMQVEAMRKMREAQSRSEENNLIIKRNGELKLFLSKLNEVGAMKEKHLRSINKAIVATMADENLDPVVKKTRVCMIHQWMAACSHLDVSDPVQAQYAYHLFTQTVQFMPKTA